VKDEAGRLLQDVEARVEIVRFDPEAPNMARSESQAARVDGFFRFACAACLELRVGFSRPGHHRQTLSANWSETAGRAAVVEKLHQQVILPAAGPLPRLERFAGRLVVAESGEEEVLPLSMGSSGRPAPLSALPKAGGAPGLPFVRLEVARGGGAIATRALPGKAAVAAPEAPRLDFGPDGGVVPAPRAGDLRAQNLAMREAPAEGYRRYLELDPDSAEVIYFYCKVGGLYGRGSATPAMVEETSRGKRVVAHVDILLNPDGSRRLEALE